ncbi:MAG: Type 1 glutamine amidotransferase-like domain-containing protein [Oscillospiraceae bacterium]|nr:Type 1 glutamine amidotransferase-like domain-containing protein [Oscillospiraceae bacterium]
MGKIVAIGGGENGRMKKDGTRYPYETGPMDREIIRLTGKEKPNFLLLAHSQPLEWQQGYFDTMKAIYGDIYGCDCKDLKSDLLTDSEAVKALIDWADIIYEGGGDTVTMIEMWRETGFDSVLRKAWEAGKVMCGVSAGANCWFTAYNTDALKIQTGDENAPMGSGLGLDFAKGYFVPHSDEAERISSASQALKTNGLQGYYLSNCRALAVVDESYKLITSDRSYHNITAFGKIAVWKNGEYCEREIAHSGEYRPIKEIIWE